MALDYRDAVSYKEKPTRRARQRGLRQRWWGDRGRGRDGGAVMDTGAAILDNSGQRHATMVRHARLYENCDFESLGGRDFGASIVRQLMTGAGLMSLNVGASCVDTLTAKVTKNHPKPTFLTSGASWKKQIRRSQPGEVVPRLLLRDEGLPEGASCFRGWLRVRDRLPTGLPGEGGTVLRARAPQRDPWWTISMVSTARLGRCSESSTFLETC